MIRKYSLLTDFIFNSTCRSINTSCITSFKWFYQKKKIVFPQTVIPNFSKDWEHQLGLEVNKSEPIKGVTDLEEYHKLPDILKKTYTYNFLSHKNAMAHETEERAKKLGINEFQDPDVYKIIRETMRIRCQKQSLLKDNRALMMEKKVRRMIRYRKSDLVQLRQDDGDMFERLCKELSIKYVPVQPRRYEPSDPKFDPIRKEVRSAKLKKIKAFREELKQSESSFYKHKRDQIEQIGRDLASLNLGLEEVFNEVIEERRERAMQPVHQDEFGWFEREKQLKIHYEKIRAAKKEARERQQRR